jgi:mRNA interferase MazF
LLRSVIVAPVIPTTHGLSTEVPVGQDDGIRRPSVANLDNVQLLGRDRFRKRIGQAQPDTMRALCAALSVAVDCGAGGFRASRSSAFRSCATGPV